MSKMDKKGFSFNSIYDSFSITFAKLKLKSIFTIIFSLKIKLKILFDYLFLEHSIQKFEFGCNQFSKILIQLENPGIAHGYHSFYTLTLGSVKLKLVIKIPSMMTSSTGSKEALGVEKHSFSELFQQPVPDFSDCLLRC